jgi:hypothetical protein
MDISGNECIHRVVVDYIDIDPDRSQQIVYCEKCFYTILSKTDEIKQPLLQSDSENQTHSSHE